MRVRGLKHEVVGHHRHHPRHPVGDAARELQRREHRQLQRCRLRVRPATLRRRGLTLFWMISLFDLDSF